MQKIKLTKEEKEYIKNYCKGINTVYLNGKLIKQVEGMKCTEQMQIWDNL